MSVIGKKPFVNTILDSLTVAQLTTLQGLVNNLGTPTLVALYGNDGIISSSNLGVSYVTFKLEEISQKIVKGILCYKDNTHCGLFAFNDTGSTVDSYRIDPVNKTYDIVNEHLTAAEFRSTIDDEFEIENGEVAGLEWVNSVKDHITEVEDSIVIDNLKPTVIYLNGQLFPSFPTSTTDSYVNKYVNGTWVWSLEAPTPSVVTLNLETILANTDVNFSCSGSGTSESPYIIMPKANIPHRYNRYQLTANTEPANDIYITLQANGLEKCQVEVNHSVAFTTHHYYVTVLDNNGNARVRISSANTISRAIWDVSGTKFIITLDVNGDNVYYATSIA